MQKNSMNQEFSGNTALEKPIFDYKIAKNGKASNATPTSSTKRTQIFNSTSKIKKSFLEDRNDLIIGDSITT